MERDFKGVWIPKEIWLNENLSMLDKVLLTEIGSLDNEKHCFASNEYFSNFLGVGIATVKRSIQKLIDEGLVERNIVNGFDRQLKLSEGWLKTSWGVAQNEPHNNTDNNKEIENTKVFSTKKFIPPTVDQVAAYCRERKNGLDAAAFVDFYASKDWMVGRNKMKDWQAAVRTWERNNKDKAVSKDDGYEWLKDVR